MYAEDSMERLLYQNKPRSEFALLSSYLQTKIKKYYRKQVIHKNPYYDKIVKALF